MLRSGYVRVVRGLAAALRAFGVLAWLERAPRRSIRFWLRTQFAIYDAVDLARLDLPWWTFAAIDAVERWIAERGGAVSAFEYGSGASTLWLARRCRSVVSVEHDAGFAATLRPLLPARGVTLDVVEPDRGVRQPRCPSGRRGYGDADFFRYVERIADAGTEFDLVVVDGRARTACLARARQFLAPGGLIVFDNSDRKRYRPALRPSDGMRVTRLRGRAPALPIRSETALVICGKPPTARDAGVLS